MNPNQRIIIEPTVTYSIKVYEGVKLVKATCNFDNFEEAYAKMKEMELELNTPEDMDISPEERAKNDKDYRLAKIEIAAAKIKNTEKEKKEEYKKKHNETKEKIRQLTPRINNLLELVNACLKNNIRPYKTDQKGELSSRNIFEAEGIYHHTGFINLKYKEVTTINYIGIINGGACGNTDLQVDKYGNAVGVYTDNYRNKITKVDPRLEDMEKFLKEFDYLEKEFLAYIDNL